MSTMARLSVLRTTMVVAEHSHSAHVVALGEAVRGEHHRHRVRVLWAMDALLGA